LFNRCAHPALDASTNGAGPGGLTTTDRLAGVKYVWFWRQMCDALARRGLTAIFGGMASAYRTDVLELCAASRLRGRCARYREAEGVRYASRQK
jgi:hypothetical protein